MAKSLKSKSKRQFRAVKREDPKSVFKVTENLRLARLSSKLRQSALKPRALTDAEEYQRRQDGYETEDEVEEVVEPEAEKEMQVDAEAGPSTEKVEVKVSTSGPRMSRRESYKTSKGFQVRLTPKTIFRSKGEGKRMGCKPNRRR